MTTILDIPKQKSFYFVRHGESTGNTEGLCQGQLDYPLTEKGIQQAKQAGLILARYKLEAICYSPLSRAKTTAEIIADVTKLDVLLPFSGLKERAWGELEGLPNTAMFEQEELERCGNYDEGSDKRRFEKKSEFLERISNSMLEVLDRPTPIAIVSHGRFFNALCELMKIPIIKQVANGAPLYCLKTEEGWQVSVVS